MNENASVNHPLQAKGFQHVMLFYYIPKMEFQGYNGFTLTAAAINISIITWTDLVGFLLP